MIILERRCIVCVQDKLADLSQRLDTFLDRYEVAHVLSAKTNMRKAHLALLAIAASVAFLFLFLGMEFVR